MSDPFDSGTSGNNLGEAGEAAGAAETAHEGVAGARARFQRLGTDVQDRYRRVTDDVRRGAGVARERYDETAETVRRGYGQVRERAGQYSGELSEYVRENPGRSILIAAGAGFLIGLLVRGRRSDDI